MLDVVLGNLSIILWFCSTAQVITAVSYFIFKTRLYPPTTDYPSKM